MATTLYIEILLLVLFSSFLYWFSSSTYKRRRMITTTHPQSSIPKNWPLVGMMPALVQNAHQIHDFTTDVIKESGGSFVFKGPWFANMDYVITADPADIQHILSKNFSNYPKGPEFKKIFEIFGDGMLNCDSQLFEIQRKTTRSLVNHPKFQNLLEGLVKDKLEKGLIPFLQHACENSRTVDLQDVFQRLTFDTICALFLDYDPLSLSIDLPHIRCEKAFSDTEEAIFYRHLLPECFWKLQRKLGIGKEKKLSEAWKSIDEFIYHCISLKQEKIDHLESFSLLPYLMEAYKETCGSKGNPKGFLRDYLSASMIAGRSTTSTALTWFFWLLSRNPLIEIKIQEEIIEMTNREEKQTFFYKAEELQKLIYLHAALCEALRLYPPISFEHKAPAQPDTLPSGHRIDRYTKTVLSFYSMGRMETIWGEDCLEFKPERWITESGGIKIQPFFKFPAFNGGPRTCLGINMAFTQMKSIAATVIYNYKVKVDEGHTIIPTNSIVFGMKHGLHVRITRRSV